MSLSCLVRSFVRIRVLPLLSQVKCFLAPATMQEIIDEEVRKLRVEKENINVCFHYDPLVHSTDAAAAAVLHRRWNDGRYNGKGSSAHGGEASYNRSRPTDCNNVRSFFGT
jgi:hypothetical protein